MPPPANATVNMFYRRFHQPENDPQTIEVHERPPFQLPKNKVERMFAFISVLNRIESESDAEA